MTDAKFTLTDLDFQLESLSFSDLTPSEFENLVFHLVDEMGFSNLVWRKGGDGNSATDGGRDLEANYWQIGPVKSAELTYWYEVKYRSGQLDKSQVQKAVLDASAEPSLDHIVIVTNSTVSNPCIDWVKDFQSKHPKPLVSIWQGHDLEVLLRKNPRTLCRFMPTALSFSGRCKVIESRFANLLLLPSVDELAELWEKRESIDDRTFLILAAVLSESAYGNLVERPWGMELKRDTLVGTLAVAVVNVYPLVHRISTLNRSQRPLLEGIAYLLGCVLMREGHELASDILYEPERLFDSAKPLPSEVNSGRMEPVLATLYDQLAVFCSSTNHCRKLYYRDPENKPNYFARFRKSSSKATKSAGFLVINSTKDECQLGLVDTGSYCPLAEDLPERDLTQEDVRARMKFAEAVLKRRTTDLGEVSN